MRSASTAPGGRGPERESQADQLGPDRARPGEAGKRSTLKGDVPPALLDRYLIERDGRGRAEAFFRDHRAPEPAFRDHGRRLSTGQAYPDTIADMLKVARHRGWSRLRVEGDEAFRRDVWIQGRAQGLEVAGYRPRERDRQAADEPPQSSGAPVDLRRRLTMASAVVRSLVADPQAQRRLLDQAAELVARRLGQDRPERSRTQNTDRSR